MPEKNKNRSGVVYSTNPDFQYSGPNGYGGKTLLPKDQLLYVSRSSKMRAGKTVTLIENFVGTTSDLEELGKSLKTKCGAGGTVKDGVILIQGDFADKVVKILSDSGYKIKRSGG